MLVFKEVTKLYGKNLGLSKTSFLISPGHMYLFIGENGSGKSTALKIIANTIKPSEFKEFTNKFKHLSYLPEKFALPPLSKPREYLTVFCGKENNIQIVEDMMKNFNLRNKPMLSMSKGMLQKVGILQTILTEADLYAFDEPLDGLDLEAKNVFLSLIQNLIEQNKTIIISTHQKEIYARFDYEEIHFDVSKS